METDRTVDHQQKEAERAKRINTTAQVERRKEREEENVPKERDILR